MPLNEWLEGKIKNLNAVDAIITTTRRRKLPILSLLKAKHCLGVKSVDMVNLSFIAAMLPIWMLDKLPDDVRVSYNSPQGLLLSHDPPWGMLAQTVRNQIGKPLHQSPVALQRGMGFQNPFGTGKAPLLIPSNRIMKEMKGSTYLTGKGVKIAVIDTGFSMVLPQWDNGRKPEIKTTIPAPPLDDMGHGTDVCNTACGGVANSPYGYVAGMAPRADLISIRALNIACVGRNIDIINALSMAHRAGAQVINMSLGSFLQGDVLEDPMCQAVDDVVFNGGRIVVAAAGNNGTEWSIRAPAASLGAIAVGCTSWTDKGERSWFSSMGPQSTWYREHMGKYNEHLERFGDCIVKPDVMAYGGGRGLEAEEEDEFIVNGSIGWGELLHDGFPDMFGSFHGTSQAAPVIAGMIALALEKEPRLTGEQIKRMALEGPKNAECGAGLLTLGRLL